MHEIIEAYEEYVELLNEQTDQIVGLAINHGWRCPQEMVDKGIELRQRIQDLKFKHMNDWK